MKKSIDALTEEYNEAALNIVNITSLRWVEGKTASAISNHLKMSDVIMTRYSSLSSIAFHTQLFDRSCNQERAEKEFVKELPKIILKK